MEDWIARHANKLILAFGLFVAWSFVSIIKNGGAIIPRIESLENQHKIHKEWAEESSYRLRKLEESSYILRDLSENFKHHTHRYYDGKIK